jgi:serine/threonine-protein kinase
MTPPAIPAQGDVIASKYEVESVLGSGGMGVVLCARHVQLGQRVAIKFMRGEAARDQSAVSRFLREARAAVALSSENVAKVLDVGTLETGEPYMVMEYLDGVDLGRVLRTSGPLSIGDAVATLLQACEAIAEAHMLGIVHRDLKPSNLFRTIRRDGSQLVKVLDFGISKTVALNSPGMAEDLTASGLLIGSPGYMSPEQVRSAKAVDTRSDIWSLGVMLYEFLAGEPPFSGESLGDTFARILSEAPPPLRRRRPEVPEGLAAVISRCLERDVSRRIPTVGHLAAQLAPYAIGTAALSIERIRRISGSSAPGAEIPAASRSAFHTMTAARSSGDSGGERAGGGPIDTGPAWLRSGTISPRRQPALRAVTIAASVVIAIAVLAISLGLYSLGHKMPAPASVDGVVAAPNAPTAPRVGAAMNATNAMERVTIAPPPVSQTEPDNAIPPPDAAHSSSQRFNPQEAPIRSETRRATPARSPAATGSSESPLENLLEQRR